MSSPNIRIQVPIELEIATRIQVLADVAQHVAKAAGASKSDLEILAYGVENRHIRQAFFLLRGKGLHSGLVVVTFDWQKHIAILASEKNSNTFSLDPTLERVGQVSEILLKVIQEIRLRIEQDGLDRSCEFSITYDSDESKDKMRERFKLSSVSAESLSSIKSLRKNAMIIGDSRLDEFAIEMNIGNGQF